MPYLQPSTWLRFRKAWRHVGKTLTQSNWQRNTVESMAYNSFLHASTAGGGPLTVSEHLEWSGLMLTSSLDSWAGGVKEFDARASASKTLTKKASIYCILYLRRTAGLSREVCYHGMGYRSTPGLPLPSQPRLQRSGPSSYSLSNATLHA